MRIVSVSAVLFPSLAGSAAAEGVWFAPPDNLDRGPRTFNDDFPHQRWKLIRKPYQERGRR